MEADLGAGEGESWSSGSRCLTRAREARNASSRRRIPRSRAKQSVKPASPQRNASNSIQQLPPANPLLHPLPQDDPIPAYSEVTLNYGRLKRLDDIVDLGIVVPERRFGVDVGSLHARSSAGFGEGRRRGRTSRPVTSQYFFIGMIEGGASTDASVGGRRR